MPNECDNCPSATSIDNGTCSLAVNLCVCTNDGGVSTDRDLATNMIMSSSSQMSLTRSGPMLEISLQFVVSMSARLHTVTNVYTIELITNIRHPSGILASPKSARDLALHASDDVECTARLLRISPSTSATDPAIV